MNTTMTVFCPIWNTEAEVPSDEIPADKTRYNSPRAGGQYIISMRAVEYIRDWETETDGLQKRLALTTYIVEQNRYGSAPYIQEETLSSLNLSTPSVDTRMERLLELLIQKTPSIGEQLHLTDVEISSIPGRNYLFISSTYANDYFLPLAWTHSSKESEVEYLIKALIELNLITQGKNMGDTDITVTPKGYQYLKKQNNLKQAFVAMWFDEKMMSIYNDGIEPAITKAGFVPMRIDKKEHANKIDDEIIAEIRNSRFLIADFTSEEHKPRGGVYFEAGFALGLGIPVIWTCHEDLIGQVHFDTRQYNHITWKNAADLEAKLYNRIRAIIV
jgi:nucleoside 2-deoxyribosyltransferase